MPMRALALAALGLALAAARPLGACEPDALNAHLTDPHHQTPDMQVAPEVQDHECHR